MPGEVLLERHERVALVTLNRPERLNAFAAATARQLFSVLDEVERDDRVRALVLTGAGRGFSAGADLRALSGADGARDTDWGSARGLVDVPLRLRRMPKPSVCAVNGVAAGAGFGIALAADFRFASAEARFIAAQIRAGLVPDAGLTYFLPRALGVERALRLLLTGEPLPAEEARAAGLVSEVVAPGELVPRALAFAAELASGPRLAMRLAREAVHHGVEGTLEEALEREYRALVEASAHPDAAEGARAFVEKRRPRFD